MKTTPLAKAPLLSLFTLLSSLFISSLAADSPPAPPAPPTPAPAAKPETKSPPKPAEIYSAFPFDDKEAAKRQDETAKALGIEKSLTLDLAGTPMKFILIPAGKYQDDTKKELTVDKPFYMAIYKVTQYQYQKIMGDNPSQHKAPENPVDSVKWANASEFCKKASEKTKKKIALPTNLQWEYACRAGTNTRCYWGDDMSKMSDYCWWHDNTMTPNSGPTHPGGKKLPNNFQLFDMMGNLWEWVADGGPTATKHDARGATFGSKEPMFRSSMKMAYEDPPINDRYGMRVILEIDQPTP